MTQIIVIKSDKGGVGKTVIASNLAVGLALTDNIRDYTFSGSTVLLIDFDPKSDAVVSCGLGRSSGIFDWLVDDKPVDQCVQETTHDNLFVLPGDATTYDALVVLEKQIERHQKPADYVAQRIGALVDQFDFDYIIIDLPPVDTLFTRDPLRIAHAMIVPTTADRIDISGALTTINQAKKLNPDLEVFVLPSIWHVGRNLENTSLDYLQTEFSDHLLDAIPASTTVREARSCGMTVWDFTRSAKVLEPFVKLVDRFKGADHGTDRVEP